MKYQSIESRFICVDCSVNTDETNEYYMVHDDLWKKHTSDFHGDGMLCIGCLEFRLGRQLNYHDFPIVPVNDGIFEMSPRFKDRRYAQNR